MKLNATFLICIFSILSLSGNAQDLYLSSGYALDIMSATQIYFNGLELVPSTDFQINGANALTKTNTPINAESINRVFSFDNTITNFEGDLVLYYEDAELNGILESNLVLQLEDDINVWHPYTSSIDANNNTITYNFISPVSFISVTASDGTTLTTDEFESTNIQVYPNPTVERVDITTPLNVESCLFDATGKQLLKTRNTTLDVSSLPSGMYLLVIENLQSQHLKTYKIIKG
ncbi:T9SS type A sorting domain-containing protein [Aestuariivivens sediminicola]|uniref:T9SS type A sorting domain-containing protein n=1 Tax=Aestuariivivens sediminicola TaxID=2913560 RepID=UPI001F5962AB|nr:T9SS type A sorting domain-containing protein [Aestuariivivens sediminicola]